MSRATIAAAGLAFSLGVLLVLAMLGDGLTTNQALFAIFCISGGLLPACYYLSEGDKSCD